MATKRVSKKYFPVLVAGLMLATIIFALGTKKTAAPMANPMVTPQPSQAQTSQTHPGYEEPKERANIKVVDIEEGGELEPREIRVKKNTVIAFKNEDTISHTVIFDNGSGGFDETVLKAGEQLYIAQYKAVGTYTYYLQVKPDEKGSVVVTE